MKFFDKLRAHFRRDTFFTRDFIREDYAEIGDYTYGKPEVFKFFGEEASLRIGRFCSISGAVTIFLGGNHRKDWITTYPFPVLQKFWPQAPFVEHCSETKGDVTIGNDVWIGYGATILSGVTIGDGAIVGAKAVVARDVAPYTIVAGNPAGPVGKRFDDAVIAQLLAIRWWDWPVERIIDHIGLLCSDDMEAFLRIANR